MCNYENSNPAVIECKFIKNATGDEVIDSGKESAGGGVFNFTDSSPTFTNCIFEMNWARHGGGLANGWSSNAILHNCQFTHNTSSTTGGGMFSIYVA